MATIQENWVYFDLDHKNIYVNFEGHLDTPKPPAGTGINLFRILHDQQTSIDVAPNIGAFFPRITKRHCFLT